MSAEKRLFYFALLAQLDRVFGYEPKGRGFESLTARQKRGVPKGVLLFLRCVGLEHRGGRRRKENSPVDCF